MKTPCLVNNFVVGMIKEWVGEVRGMLYTSNPLDMLSINKYFPFGQIDAFPLFIDQQ